MKILMISCLLLSSTLISAQVITISGANATGNGEAIANDHLVPVPGAPGIAIFDDQLCTLGNFTPGLLGNDYGTYCFARAIEQGDVPFKHKVASDFGSRAFINGNNTSEVRIKWKNTGHNYAVSDGYNANFQTTLNVSVNMSVINVPAGIPVTIYWRYDIFGSGSTDHEGMPFFMEDYVTVMNTMIINGTSQFSNQFDFISPPGLAGWNEWKNRTGTFLVTSGTNFNFTMTSLISCFLDVPGPGAFPPIDKNDGQFRGIIYFSVAPLYEVPVNNTDTADNMLMLFSLDIGSDAELSDPQQDGNEVFDPGDMYPKSNIGPLPTVTPWKDDSLIFAHDPDPKPFFPVNPAPVGSGLLIDLVRKSYFDLDGSDLLATSLLNSGIVYGPGYPSIPYFSDSCIYEAEYIFVSFDDDTPEHFTSQAVPSVPVNSNSSGLDTIYGDFGNQDEVREYEFDAMLVSGPYSQDDINSELDLHINLAPDPSGNNNNDDDADALDIIPINGNISPCTQWYFSADHEASYNDPSFGAAYLDPASVYEVTPTGPVPVINSFNTGLQDGTDMDDFEFVWLWDENELRFGLALLFTVDDDDTLTSENETGGLDPRMIYYSFLNGSSQAFSATPLPDDVDGLTVWQNSLNGTIAYPNPVWGTKTWTGDVNRRWQNPLNWFPQGVPFDPEDVIIPNITRMPIIGIDGLDCRSLNIEPGASIILQNGITFSVKGP